MNLMHQAQLVKEGGAQGGKEGGGPPLQALLLQHQQIMQQIQLVQRQFALASALTPFGVPQGELSKLLYQGVQIWI